MSGYREAEILRRCVDCEQTATGECARCGRPHCPSHVLPPDTLCEDCEDEWSLVGDAETASTGIQALWTACAFIGGAVAIAVLPAAGLFAVIGGAVGGAGVPYWAWKLTRSGRPKFIAEGARHDRIRALWGRERRTDRQLPPASSESRD